jgi:hypothetical protein
LIPGAGKAVAVRQREIAPNNTRPKQRRREFLFNLVEFRRRRTPDKGPDADDSRPAP